MRIGLDHIIDSLGKRERILPHFETALLADAWPESYAVHVDSGVYYGLDEDGAPDGYFHPSSHPTMDERQLYYLFHPAYQQGLIPEPRHFRRQMWLAMGSALHAVLQTQMKMAGLVRCDCKPDEQGRFNHTCGDVEWEYVNHEHWIRGRLDWVCHMPNGDVIPVEFKTQNSFQFKRGIEPKVARPQLNLALDAYGVDFGIILVAERGGNFDMVEIPVHKDQELLDAIYGKFDRVRAAIRDNEIPRHCCMPGSDKMNECPARGVCWLADEQMQPNLARI